MSPTTYPSTNAESTREIFRLNARTIHQIVRLNVEGFTQAESLIQPQPGGNCVNWVLGHLLCVQERAVMLVGQKPVLPENALNRYDRGTPPIESAGDAMELAQLLDAWDRSAERLDAGLTTITAEHLDAPAPFSPTGNPKETVQSLLTVILFHQAYHAGQIGLLRRIAGKQGAIK